MRDEAESASLAVRKTGLAQQRSRAKKRARSSRLTRRLPIQAPLRAWCTPLSKYPALCLALLIASLGSSEPAPAPLLSTQDRPRRSPVEAMTTSASTAGDCSFAPGSQQLSSPLPDVDDPVDFPVQDLIDVVHVMNMERTQGKHNLSHLRFAYNWAQTQGSARRRSQVQQPL